jgi:hypothetical protein
VRRESTVGAEVEAARRVLDRLGAAERSTVHADAAAVLARAAAYASLFDPAYAREACHYLNRLDALEIRKESRAGWGLPYAFGTFAKGSPNPADTIYGYTTAVAGLAFLDAAIILGRRRWAERAEGALQTLFCPEFTDRSGGSLVVWYSDARLDQRPEYVVYNANALVLALASRIDRYRPTPGYARERKALTRLLLDSQGVGVENPKVSTLHNWRYASGRPTKINDLVHEAFIVEGVLEARTAKARKAAARALNEMWQLHFDGEGRPHRRRFTQGSRGWGPPAALCAFCAARGFDSHAAAIARSLAATIDATGKATLVEHETESARGEAWYALALWQFAARVKAPELFA